MISDHVYIIAEAGVNHNGQKKLAYELIDIAADAGADAVKFQTFNAKKLASKFVKKADYQNITTEAGQSQLEMLQKLELPQKWHVDLQSYARKKGIEFLSTPFDKESLFFLNNLDIPIFKVPSGEITNGPLLWMFAKTNRPLILSTGMSTLSEVEQALAIINHANQSQSEPKSIEEVWKLWSHAQYRESLRKRVILLHCTSQYPTPYDEVNLKCMDTLSSAFELSVGYSDHTQGLLIPIAAVARGAKVIEKHFTINRNLIGPDHLSSLEPDELREMVRNIRNLEVAIGSGIKSPQPSEWNTKDSSRQQIIALKNINAGSKISKEDLGTARCGYGLVPTDIWKLIGKKSSRDYLIGEIIQE